MAWSQFGTPCLLIVLLICSHSGLLLLEWYSCCLSSNGVGSEPLASWCGASLYEWVGVGAIEGSVLPAHHTWGRHSTPPGRSLIFLAILPWNSESLRSTSHLCLSKCNCSCTGMRRGEEPCLLGWTCPDQRACDRVTQGGGDSGLRSPRPPPFLLSLCRFSWIFLQLLNALRTVPRRFRWLF